MLKVTAESFLKNKELCAELKALFPSALFWEKKEPLAEFCADAEVLIVGREKMSDDLLSHCPRLKFISKYGVGLDNLDREACERRGIRIGFAEGVNKTSVAELTLAFMLGAVHNSLFTGSALKIGSWIKNGGRLLSGKTVGIIGAGNIGREVIRMLQPFGCRILVNDILINTDFKFSDNLLESLKNDIFTNADLISFHVPLTEETRNMVNAETLGMMKPNVILINTARGEIWNETALKNWLAQTPDAFVCTDVYHEEPCTDLEFLQHPRVFGTPHIGGNAYEAVMAMGRSAIAHVTHFYHGKHE
jgi:phosphoglycerate dehydrogenase-like enzyme